MCSHVLSLLAIFLMAGPLATRVLAAEPSRGVAISIGLNRLDSKHYGDVGDLTACEFDAKDMDGIAESQGFKERTILLSEKATREAVKSALKAASSKLDAGDILVISFSGHGGQVADVNGDEVDGTADETWCLYDGQILDDELAKCWTDFADGVRIFVISDSCHSGTITMSEDLSMVQSIPAVEVDDAGPEVEDEGGTKRELSERDAIGVYKTHKKFYDKVGTSELGESGSVAAIKATVILISGCEDGQTASDGTTNGRFTKALKAVWNDGKFEGNYNHFRSAILKRLPPDQSPAYFVIGPDNPAFESQKPWAK